MKSRIFIGETWHGRYQPRAHTFRYNLYFFGVCLGELSTLDQRSKLFGYNRRALFSIWDRDYLGVEKASIAEKLSTLLEQGNVEADIDQTTLITVPRYFGYVFNPVNFFLCYTKTGELSAVVAEVNNTFDQRHVYLMKRNSETRNESFIRFTFPKEFYVSPFLDVEGEYEILLRSDHQDFDIRVNILKGGEKVFASRLCGKGKKLNTRNLSTTLLKRPLAAWSTVTLIHWQALKLYFGRKLGVYQKPALTHCCSMQLRKSSASGCARNYLVSNARKANVQ